MPQVLPAHSASARGPQHSCDSGWFLCDQKHSAIWVNYEDNPAAWSVWFTYSGCPQTSRGAFRLTVYQTSAKPPGLVQRTVQSVPRKAHQVAKTRVYWRTSGGGTYTFNGRGERFNYYRFDIPSERGCQYWATGTITN
jgi:hypothetical protein